MQQEDDKFKKFDQLQFDDEPGYRVSVIKLAVSVLAGLRLANHPEVR